MQLTEYENKSLEKLAESIHNGKWSNDGMVQLIELCGDYLNLATLPSYAKRENISYNGAKIRARTNGRLIFGEKFIIDNQ